MEQEQTQKIEPVIEFGQAKKQLSVQSSIILGSIIIAIAIVLGPVIINTDSIKTTKTTTEVEIKIEPVTSNDHILGNTDTATVYVVEYSDLECPFCKVFHETMHRVVEHYDGKVAWVFRQFPIDSLHTKAREEAHASECVAELGGNTAFWSYIDRIFETTTSNDGLDLSVLPIFAIDLGIDKALFTECMTSNRHAEKIKAMEDDGIAAGLQGTPYSVIVTQKGKTVPINGNLPFSEVIKLIDPLVK